MVEQAVVLCGGLGERLRPFTDSLPKAMVDVAGRPFLEILIEQLAEQGVERFVLCTGYRGESIRDHFGDGSLQAGDVAGGIVGAVVSDPVHDQVVWREYLEGVVAERPEWADFYEACRQLDT